MASRPTGEAFRAMMRAVLRRRAAIGSVGFVAGALDRMLATHPELLVGERELLGAPNLVASPMLSPA